MTEAQKPLIGGEPLGNITTERWQTLAGQLKELGDISQALYTDDRFKVL